MIGPTEPTRASMASGAAHPLCSDATVAAIPTAAAVGTTEPAAAPVVPEPILCGHCGRTASNGISCQGMCVADSGY